MKSYRQIKKNIADFKQLLDKLPPELYNNAYYTINGMVLANENQEEKQNSESKKRSI